MKNLLAKAVDLGGGTEQIGGGEGFGSFPAENLGNAGLDAIIKIVSTIVGFITICAGLYFMIQFLVGGFEWISASGDKGKLEKAQNRITHSVIGLIIVVAAYAITSIIGNVLGLDILFSNTDAAANLLKQLQLNLGK